MAYKYQHLYVKVSSIELRSVLSNLINNSSEAYGDVGGKVEISVIKKSDQCEIAVKDFGAGIPQEIVSELGKKIITTKDNSGRGIGLLHAFKSISAHGGSISITSSEGVGTVVTVCLPVYSFHSQKKEHITPNETIL